MVTNDEQKMYERKILKSSATWKIYLSYLKLK